MKLATKSRLIVFTLSFFVWLAITYSIHWQVLLSGAGVSVLVAGLVGGIFVKTGKSIKVYRLYYFIWYLAVLFWEMAHANFHVAFIVIHPDLSIRSCLISIKTELKEDSSWTILANSISLTPGTLTVDADKKSRQLFIHCMTVETTDMRKVAADIERKFEPVLRRFMR